MAMQQVSDKNTLKTYFIKFWSSQNVSNNCCEKIREVFRLWKKFRYFFFLLMHNILNFVCIYSSKDNLLNV